MPNIDSASTEPNDLQAQITQLREHVDALMKDREARSVAGARRVEAAVCDAMRAIQQGTANLSSSIRKQPFLALLIAVGSAYLVGRALR
jgi:hypothetical protein